MVLFKFLFAGAVFFALVICITIGREAAKEERIGKLMGHPDDEQ
jgi:hypothetical protein